MIFFRITNYLKYILLSGHRNGHGIHSPFIFDIVNRQLRNKIDLQIVLNAESARRRFLSDNRTIAVEDFGYGGLKQGAGKRRISDIARNSPVTKKYGIFLAKLSAELGNQTIIELGTSLGISTMYMALASKGSSISTIEGSEALAEIAGKNFAEAGLDNVKVYAGKFDEVLPGLIKDVDIKRYPVMIYIDGDHRHDSLINNFEIISKNTKGKTLVVIDDINYSPEMNRAWNAIRKFEKVSASINIYRMGILFLWGNITPKDYIIRY